MTTSISTEGLTREEWLALRRRGIGGSDVAAILGLSKWHSPLDVYRDKIGEGADQPDSPAMEWGRRLEPVIREKYAEATGLAVEKPDLMLISGDHPYMVADLDGICSDGRSLYADDDGELAEATNDEAVLIGELKAARARLKELEAETKALESQLIVAIGARAGLTIGGEKAVTYKTQTSRRFSATAFKAEAPADTYAKYVTETKTRVLRIA